MGAWPPVAGISLFAGGCLWWPHSQPVMGWWPLLWSPWKYQYIYLYGGDGSKTCNFEEGIVQKSLKIWLGRAEKLKAFLPAPAQEYLSSCLALMVLHNILAA